MRWAMLLSLLLAACDPNQPRCFAEARRVSDPEDLTCQGGDVELKEMGGELILICHCQRKQPDAALRAPACERCGAAGGQVGK